MRVDKRKASSCFQVLARQGFDERGLAHAGFAHEIDMGEAVFLLDAEAWFDKSVLNDPEFYQDNEISDSTGKHGTLSYTDDGQVLRVNWSEFALTNVDTRDRLTLQACIYVPDHITLLDTAFDGAHGRVKFQETFRLSILGKKMKKAGLFETNIDAAMPANYEYLAELQKMASGGWSVRSVRLL